MCMDQKSKFCQNVGSSHFTATSYFVDSDVLVYSSLGEAEAWEQIFSAEGKQVKLMPHLPDLLQLDLWSCPVLHKQTDHCQRLKAERESRERPANTASAEMRRDSRDRFSVNRQY